MSNDATGNVSGECYGSLSVWPFSDLSAEEIARSMTKHGVYIASNKGTSFTIKHGPFGLEVEESGQDVYAYFVDEFGIESSETDLEDFIMDVVPANKRFYIQGRHDLDGGKIVVSQMIAIHDGIGVVWSKSRTLFSRDEAAKSLLNEEDPMTLHGLKPAEEESSMEIG